MKRTIAFSGELDLARTVGALAMRAARGAKLSAGEAWVCGRTPDGPVTLQLVVDGGRLEAQAWGPGAEWRLDSVEDLVGIDDRPEEFAPRSGIVRDLHRRAMGLRLGRTGAVFETLLPAILGQRVTGREAKAAYRGIVAAWGEPAPGPVSISIPPPPSVVAALGYDQLHRFGVEKARASILIETARRANRLEEITRLTRPQALSRLLAIRGIGPWTAAQAMGIAWGDRDAVPVGDFHLPNEVAWALAGEPRGTDERMLELLEDFPGQRRRVIVLIKQAGITAPRFGPRTAIRTIADM